MKEKSKLNEVNFRVTDKKLVNNIKAYCNINHISYIDFANRVFDNFFSNERSKLELMSKEQLIDVILTWRKEDKQWLVMTM